MNCRSRLFKNVAFVTLASQPFHKTEKSQFFRIIKCYLQFIVAFLFSSTQFCFLTPALSYAWRLIFHSIVVSNAWSLRISNILTKMKWVEGCLLIKKHMLSSSFRCNQIHSYHRYYFGYALLCYLSHLNARFHQIS